MILINNLDIFRLHLLETFENLNNWWTGVSIMQFYYELTVLNEVNNSYFAVVRPVWCAIIGDGVFGLNNLHYI
jgi:hypothetical protein